MKHEKGMENTKRQFYNEDENAIAYYMDVDTFSKIKRVHHIMFKGDNNSDNRRDMENLFALLLGEIYPNRIMK